MGHTYTSLNYHLIFSTKGRVPLLVEPLRPRIYAYLGGIVRQMGGEMVSIGGVEDHVHILVHLKATLSLAEVMRNLKGSSSKWVNDELPGPTFAWQAGYTAFSVSRSNMNAVERYLAGQEEHHRHHTFQEELLEFLRAHRVDFDERYCGTDLRPYGAHTPDRAGFPRLKPWASLFGRSAAMTRAGAHMIAKPRTMPCGRYAAMTCAGVHLIARPRTMTCRSAATTCAGTHVEERT